MAIQALLAPGAVGNPNQAVVPLFDPRSVWESRRRFFRDDIPELAYANSFYLPSGRWPARGWILVRRGDYNQIPSLYATNFQLQIDDLQGRGPLLFQNLAIVQARCVTRGIAADPDALYLVELTDGRGVVQNPWAQVPTTSAYNIRAPAYPGQYDLATLRGGVPWTWDQMLEDLWKQMLPFLGTYPGLDEAPLGTPEGWQFLGESAWEALNQILDYLGVGITCDLTLADDPYGLDFLLADDFDNESRVSRFAPLLEDDYEYLDSGSGRIPGQVLVYFHTRYQYYGTEETVRNDFRAWSKEFFHGVLVPAPAPFNQAAGTGYVWADFTLRRDEDGLLLPADLAQVGGIAQQVAEAYYARMTQGSQGYLRRVYAGALPFTAGPLLDGVCWFQNFQRPGPDGPSRFGWCTETVRGAQPPWPLVQVQPVP